MVILGLLCFIVFSLERRDLSDRLGASLSFRFFALCFLNDHYCIFFSLERHDLSDRLGAPRILSGTARLPSQVAAAVAAPPAAAAAAAPLLLLLLLLINCCLQRPKFEQPRSMSHAEPAVLCPAVPRCAGIVVTLLLCVAMPPTLSLLCPAVLCCAGIVVTLFLSMAAVQFVIQEGQPASSYILPTQVTHCSRALTTSYNAFAAAQPQ